MRRLNQITCEYAGMIGKMLRLNTDAVPEIPDSQRLPFDDAEDAWRRGRDAICTARVNPGHTPEPPNANRPDMQLGCTMFLTQEHMDDLADLYFLVLEGPA